MDNNWNIPPPNNNASWGQYAYNNGPAYNWEQPPMYYTVDPFFYGNAGSTFPNAAASGMLGVCFNPDCNCYLHPMPGYPQFIPDINAWLYRFPDFPDLFAYYVPEGPDNPLPYVYSVAVPAYMQYMPDGMMHHNPGPPTTNMYTNMDYPLPYNYGYAPNAGWGAFRETAPLNRGYAAPPCHEWIPPQYRQQVSPQDCVRENNTTEANQCSASAPDGAANALNTDTSRCMLDRPLSTESDQAVPTSSQSPIDNPSVTAPQKPSSIALPQTTNGLEAAAANDDSSVAPSISRRSRPARRAVFGDNASEMAPSTIYEPSQLRKAAWISEEAAHNAVNRARSASPCDKNQDTTIADNQGKRSKSAAPSEDKTANDAAVVAASGLKRSKSVDSLSEESANPDISVCDIPFCFTARPDVKLPNPSRANNAQTSRAAYSFFNGGQPIERQRIAKKVSKHALLDSPMLSKAAQQNEKDLVNNIVETNHRASNVEHQDVGNSTSNTSAADPASVDSSAASTSTASISADASVPPLPSYNLFTIVEYNGADFDDLNGNIVPSIPMQPTYFADDTSVSRIVIPNDTESITNTSAADTASAVRVTPPQTYSLFTIMEYNETDLNDLNENSAPAIPMLPKYSAGNGADYDPDNLLEDTRASNSEARNDLELIASTSDADTASPERLSSPQPYSLLMFMEYHRAGLTDLNGGGVPAVPKRPEYPEGNCGCCDAEDPAENTNVSKELQIEIEPFISASAADVSLAETSPIDLFESIEFNQAVYKDADRDGEPGNHTNVDREDATVDSSSDDDDEVFLAVFDGLENELYVGMPPEIFKFFWDDDDM